jgi:hypothetical protein
MNCSVIRHILEGVLVLGLVDLHCVFAATARVQVCFTKAVDIYCLASNNYYSPNKQNFYCFDEALVAFVLWARRYLVLVIVLWNTW